MRVLGVLQARCGEEGGQQLFCTNSQAFSNNSDLTESKPRQPLKEGDFRYLVPGRRDKVSAYRSVLFAIRGLPW